MLEIINNPSDIKDLNVEQLDELSSDIRTFLIENISKTGGHLGSNLGIVELTIAIHKTFNSPVDKIVFDVGHQSYVHKILTERKEKFPTLRQYGGLSGFIKFEESKHDVWEAGHSSTSISGAMGYAISNKLNGKDSHVICIIGDGSLTNGLSLEALNHLCDTQSKMILVLNDNEMSISKNIGFVDKVLKNLHNNKEYKDTKTIVKNNLNKTQFGSQVAKAISISKGKVKNEFVNEAHNFFDMIGMDYIGPIDGHNIQELESSLELSKKFETPVVLHVKTLKGKGYSKAEDEKWHGVGPFDIQTGEAVNKQIGISYSKFISEIIYDKMKSGEDIVVITPAMLGGSELNKLKTNFPDRVYDVGIAEEHAITFAAGLAIAGKKPFVSIYSTFLQRAYDEVFHDIVRQNANVVIGIDRAGLVGEDGETHQGIYDISFLAHMHGLVIVQGNDDYITKSLLDYAFDYNGPIAIRYPRGGNFNIQLTATEEISIELGKWLYKGTSQLNIIAYGEMYNLVQNVLEKLNNDKISLINAIFIKPLDEELLLSISDKDILVVEEHTDNGSLATQILNFYNTKEIAKIVRKVNLRDQFIPQGHINKLREVYEIDEVAIENKIKSILEK